MVSLKQVLSQSVSSDSDLLWLARSIGVRVDQIDFKQYMDREADYAILNMGTPQLGGTHWIAVSNKDKLYFDPLGLPPPRLIPTDYSYRALDIQNPKYGRCGQYCVLWLWYVQHDKVDDFYRMFLHYDNLASS